MYFQLVIKEEIFALSSVETLIKKCRDIVTYANSSDKFYAEFYKQQEAMGITDRRSLKGDTPTR